MKPAPPVTIVRIASSRQLVEEHRAAQAARRHPDRLALAPAGAGSGRHPFPVYQPAGFDLRTGAQDGDRPNVGFGADLGAGPMIEPSTRAPSPTVAPDMTTDPRTVAP